MPEGGGVVDPQNDGALDLRRKAQIAFGKAQDHAAEVVVAALPGFDLDETIFTTGLCGFVFFAFLAVFQEK